MPSRLKQKGLGLSKAGAFLLQYIADASRISAQSSALTQCKLGWDGTTAQGDRTTDDH